MRFMPFKPKTAVFSHIRLPNTLQPSKFWRIYRKIIAISAKIEARFGRTSCKALINLLFYAARPPHCFHHAKNPGACTAPGSMFITVFYCLPSFVSISAQIVIGILLPGNLQHSAVASYFRFLKSGIYSERLARLNIKDNFSVLYFCGVGRLVASCGDFIYIRFCEIRVRYVPFTGSAVFLVSNEDAFFVDKRQLICSVILQPMQLIMLKLKPE